MPKPIVFIAALLLALPAFAQTRMPARQVEADTNMVNIAVSLPFTAQAALNWIDANWPTLSSESWSNLGPAEDTVQSVFDWVDDNWQAISSESWSNLDPESPTTQSAFDWIDDEWMAVDPSSWAFLPTNASTSQLAFDFIDGWVATNFFSDGTNWLGFLQGTNLVGATFTNGQWVVNSLPGTNIFLGSYDPTTLTWSVTTFTNISLKQSTNWSFTINTNTHVGELTYAPYEAPGLVTVDTNTLVADLRRPTTVLADAYAADALLGGWNITNAVGVNLGVLANTDADGFYCISNGTNFAASLDVWYNYGGIMADPVAFKVVKVAGLSETVLCSQTNATVNWAAWFRMTNTQFALNSGDYVRVKLLSPDGGSTLSGSFKLLNNTPETP